MRKSAKLIIQEVAIFWENARIPIRLTCHCIDKLVYPYNELKNLQRSSKKKNANEKEKPFIEKLYDLYDISHANAFELIEVEEDKQFLSYQQKKGRPGFMFGMQDILVSPEINISEQPNHNFEDVEQEKVVSSNRSFRTRCFISVYKQIYSSTLQTTFSSRKGYEFKKSFSRIQATSISSSLEWKAITFSNQYGESG